MIELEHIEKLFHPSVITLVILLLTGIGALIGYVIRYQFDKKKELVSEVNKERRAVYQELTNLLFGILENVKVKKQTDGTQLAKKMFAIHKKNVLYASPKVIRAFNDFLSYAQSIDEIDDPKPQVVLFKLSELIGAMRKDLGLSNKRLGQNHRKLLRSSVTDIDKF